ncbi:MAG: hypothetical protein M1826_000835 [Phylliscum demangeonii]|nr:MAG: hypothetical protein M1826_000835 [Phylliscum demangeonii]
MSDDEYSNIDSFLFRPFADPKMPRGGRATAVAPAAGVSGGDRAEPPTVATMTTASVGTAGENPPPPPKKEGGDRQPPCSRGKFEGLPVVVVPHYCTRCAKRLAVEPELVCKRRVGLKRCERCIYLDKSPLRVLLVDSELTYMCQTPTKYQPRVEALQLAASAVVLSSANCRAAAQSTLNSQVRDYTARVKGFVCCVGRGPPPGTYTAAERETHRLLRAIIRGQRRIKALYRSEHKLPVFESDDEADVDNKKEAARKVPTGKDAGGDQANGDDGGDEDEGAGEE